MKKLKNITLILLFFILILFMKNKVNAASITASPSAPKKGQSVTITVSVYANTVDLTATVSGAGTSGTIRLVDGSMSGDAKTFSKSITVKPTSTGTIKVSISSSSNAVLNGSYVQGLAISKSISVTEPSSNSGGTSGGTSGKKPSSGGSTTTKPVEEKKSTDNTLSALSVKEGNISPEFKKDVKEYTLKIPYELSAVNVTATPSDSKAKVAITGNTDLKEGENTVTVKVTAEDGTVAEYKIKVTRARVPLALQSLIVKYENENGELVEAPLNPVFDINTYDYSLQDLEYWVEKLSVEAISNLEGATIDIQGADNLQIGENTIVITVKIAAEGSENVAEGEEPKEEIVTYTIKVNKTEEPTIFQKISNWFKGIFGGVSNWYNQNEKNIIVGALSTCIVALFGLSIYIVVDHNKYKDVIDKLKKVNEMNLNSNTIVETNQTNAKEEISKNIEEPKEKKDKKNGKRFK